MKLKKINIRLVVFIILIILVILLAIFGIMKLKDSTNNESGYKQITVEEYTQIVEANNYTINDITENMSSYNYIEKAVMAVAENEEYQIEYYLFKDEVSTINFVENKKTAISMAIGHSGNIEDSTTEEYIKYSGVSDTSYCTMFVIGKTVICADSKIEYKEELDNMLTKLGYAIK